MAKKKVGRKPDRTFGAGVRKDLVFKGVLRKARREMWQHFDNNTCYSTIKASVPRHEQRGKWRAKLLLQSLEQYTSAHLSGQVDIKPLSVTLGLFLGKLNAKDISEAKDEYHSSGTSMLKYYQSIDKAMNGIFKTYSNEKLNMAMKIPEIQCIFNYFDALFSRPDWTENELKAHSLIMKQLE